MLMSGSRRSQSIRGGGVGGAPPPRTGFATAKYPTSSHYATQLSLFAPQDVESDLWERAHSALRRGLTPAAGDERSPAATAGRRAAARIARVLAVSAVCRPVG